MKNTYETLNMAIYNEKVDRFWISILAAINKDEEWYFDLNEQIQNSYKVNQNLYQIYEASVELVSNLTKLHGILLFEITKRSTIKITLEKIFSVAHHEYYASTIDLNNGLKKPEPIIMK